MADVKWRHLGHYALREPAQDDPQQSIPGYQIVLIQTSKDCNLRPDGVVRQRCGGGHRIVRKRIGNN